MDRRVSNGGNDETLRRVLARDKTIAVVGASPRWDRPSCRIMQYMQAMGYTVFPVNPLTDETVILGRTVHANLADIAAPIAMVNVFRKPGAVAEVTRQAIDIGAKSIWMQDGISDAAAADTVRAAGLDVVMDACFKREHFRLFGGAEDPARKAGGQVDSEGASA